MAEPRDIPTWLQENQQFFLPPVCNKMYHGDGQMKAFFVGGPNQRKDYHIEEGEELFYQWKGDMILKIVERGEHRDVVIKEGEIFLLPARIPHSPQRFEETIGLVLERERSEDEVDGLRYYVDGTTDSLFEKWFHCDDLAKDLPPVIKEYFASEQHRTQKPIPGTIPDPCPVKIDSTTKVNDPFPLSDWLRDNAGHLDDVGAKEMFGNLKGRQFQVHVYKGTTPARIDSIDVAETFVWQLAGSSVLSMAAESEPISLKTNSTFLVPQAKSFEMRNETKDGVCLVARQDPRRK